MLKRKPKDVSRTDQTDDSDALIQNLIQNRKLQQEALIKIMASIDLKDNPAEPMTPEKPKKSRKSKH